MGLSWQSLLMTENSVAELPEASGRSQGNGLEEQPVTNHELLMINYKLGNGLGLEVSV